MSQNHLFVRQHVDDRGSGEKTIGGRPRRRLDIGDQLGQVICAGFGDMDFVADPLRRALLSVMGIAVGGRTDEDRRRRDIVWGTPLDVPLDQLILPHPRLAQRLHRRNLA